MDFSWSFIVLGNIFGSLGISPSDMPALHFIQPMLSCFQPLTALDIYQRNRLKREQRWLEPVAFSTVKSGLRETLLPIGYTHIFLLSILIKEVWQDFGAIPKELAYKRRTWEACLCRHRRSLFQTDSFILKI